MTSFLNILPQLLRSAGDSEEAREQAVFAAWSASVGIPVLKATAPIRLERKTLLIAVADATWREQLKRIRGHALFKLNSLLGAPTVTQIEFIINKDFVARNHSQPPEIKFNAPEEQARPLRDKVDRIADPDIRETFLRAAGKCLDRRSG
ncbi:MAG: DUF721 domain-containing protein [Acidobacteriota bacterium]